MSDHEKRELIEVAVARSSAHVYQSQFATGPAYITLPAWLTADDIDYFEEWTALILASLRRLGLPPQTAWPTHPSTLKDGPHE